MTRINSLSKFCAKYIVFDHCFYSTIYGERSVFHANRQVSQFLKNPCVTPNENRDIISLYYIMVSHYILLYGRCVMKVSIWKDITKNRRFRSVFQQIEYLQMNLDDSCGRGALLGGCSATRSTATISDAYYIFNSLVGIATKLHSDNAGAHRESSIFYSPRNPFAASLSCLAI